MSRLARLLTAASALATVVALASTPASAHAVSNGRLHLGSFQLVGGGGELIRFITAPTVMSGELVEHFHGDRATGCASHGTCGYTGTVYWHAPRTGALLVDEVREGRIRKDMATISFGDYDSEALASASVHETGAAANCVDANPSQGIDLPVRGGEPRIDLLGAGALTTRCAGPLGSDLRAALPAPRIAVEDLLRHGSTLDLSGTRSFAAHGWVGTIESTLRLRVERGHLERLTNPGGHHVKWRRERQITVTYRGRVHGTVDMSIRGVANHVACWLLDSCGTTGSLGLNANASVDLVRVAYGPATRPARDMLAALGLSRRGNPRNIVLASSATWDSFGTVTADVHHGASVCTDRAGGPSGLLGLDVVGRRLRVALSVGDFFDSALRTRCPGPAAAQATIATGSISVRNPLPARLTIPLSHGTTFDDPGYATSTSPQLTLRLSRASVKTAYFRVQVGF